MELCYNETVVTMDYLQHFSSSQTLPHGTPHFSDRLVLAVVI
jgi:hypothetical protein